MNDIDALQSVYLDRSLLDSGNATNSRALLENGANPNAHDEQGWTALHKTGLNDADDARCRVLLEHGANPEARDNNGLTPLHLAGINNNARQTSALLAAHADVNARDNDGNTPLHYAGTDTDTAQVLLAAGADPNAQNKAGKTPPPRPVAETVPPRNARNEWGAYSKSAAPSWTQTLMRDAEHAGTWSAGFERHDKKNATAINADLYGWAEVQGDRLAVVQVREATISKYGTSVRKSYLLLGRGENGQPFAHTVESPRRSATAMQSPESTVRWALSAHVWHCDPADLDHIVRQGDIALVPTRRVPATAQPVDGDTVTVRNSHKLHGQFSRDQDGTLYARGEVQFDHTPGQHAPVHSKRGLWRVQEGERADYWAFVNPRAAEEKAPATGLAARVAEHAAQPAPDRDVPGMGR